MEREKRSEASEEGMSDQPPPLIVDSPSGTNTVWPVLVKQPGGHRKLPAGRHRALEIVQTCPVVVEVTIDRRI